MNAFNAYEEENRNEFETLLAEDPVYLESLNLYQMRTTFTMVY